MFTSTNGETAVNAVYRNCCPSDLFCVSDVGESPHWLCWGTDYRFMALMDDFGTAVPVVYPSKASSFSGMLIAVRHT
jgi:hypothetical protein